MAASPEVLGELHSIFARHLMDLLKPEIDEEGKEQPPAISAGQLAVIAKFLKDNDIATTDNDDQDVADLKEQLRKRAASQGFHASDVEAALEDTAFKAGFH